MSNPVIAELIQATDEAQTVMESATTLVNGIATRLEAAVKAALVNGATAAELAPISDEVSQLKSSSAALSAAVVANTPAAEETPEEPPVETPTEVPSDPNTESRGRRR